MDANTTAILNAIVDTLTSPAVGGAIVALAGLMVGDFLTAISAAFKNDEISPLIIAEFLRSHVLGRLMPIVGLIVLSTFTPALVPVVGLAVGAYTVETIASIKANLDLHKPIDEA